MIRFTFFAILLCVIAGAPAVSTRVSEAFTPVPQKLEYANSGNEAPAKRLPSTAQQTDASKRRTSFITGRLTDDAGQPIPNAGVFVTKAGPLTGQRRSLGTDEEGRFRADDLAPGAYSVSAYVPGYVPASEAVEREYYRPGEAVNLRMMKGGIITGTVTNSSGEPVVGVRVSPVRVRDGEGRRIRGVSQSGGGNRLTDDRGVYRIYGLAPGTYLVVAGGGGQMGYPPSGYDGDAPTYHPSTTRDAAAEVVVRGGQEMTGIDIRYRGDRGYIVSGTLSGALGPEGGMRSVVLMLSHTASGAVESRTFVQPRAGRGFALSGVPDGDYELVAQVDIGTETSAASSRHVVVKGSDVTGIELSLAPLGFISGRAVLETIPEAERSPECKSKRITSLDELVLTARRDEKPGAKDPPGGGVFSSNEGSPDEKGEFKILSLSAARYRIEVRLPGEDWFVRSMTRAGPAGSKPNDVAAAGLGLNTGQRITDLTVTLAEGAAAVRGKVIPVSEGSRLPANIRVHMVPAEPESADDAIRFSEAIIDSEGIFSLTNLAPGIYYVLVRAVANDQLMERNPQPTAWDPTARAKLRREALAAKVLIELQRCQRVTDYVIKYTSKPARKTEPKKTQ